MSNRVLVTGAFFPALLMVLFVVYFFYAGDVERAEKAMTFGHAYVLGLWGGSFLYEAKAREATRKTEGKA